MGDNDATPPGRRRARYMEGDTQRSSTHSERRRREAELIDVPEIDIDDITSPVELLLERDLEGDDASIVERMRRDSRDPYEMIYQLAKADRVRKAEEKSGNRELVGMIAKSFEDVKRDVETLKRAIAPFERFAGWVFGGLGAAALAIGIFLYTRGGDETATRMRLDLIEKAITETTRDIRALERHGNHKDSP